MNSFRFNQAWIHFIALAVIATTLILYGVNSIDERPPTGGDATENMAAVYNLVKHSTFSTEPYYVFWKNPNYHESSVEANMYREPLPPTIVAIFVKLFLKETTSLGLREFLLNPKIIKIVKITQLSWIIITAFLFYLNIFAISRNRNFAVFTTMVFIGGVLYFGSYRTHINRLYTEIPFSALMLLFSFFFFKANLENKNIYYILSGLSLGISALIKAIMLYVFFVLFLFFLVYLLCYQNKGRQAVKTALSFFIAFLVIAGPWMARNKVLFNEFTISNRAGVIYTRYLMNDISDRKLGAAFYWFSPPPIRKQLEGIWDISERDFELKGQYAIINIEHARRGNPDREAIYKGNPSGAVSYFGKNFAFYNRLLMSQEYEDKGNNKVSLVDRKLTELGKQGIKNNLMDHIIATPVFAWRGIHNGFFGDVTTMFVFIGFFIFVFYNAIKLKFEYLSIVILPIILFGIYASLTHFIPRYSFALMPNIFMSLCLLLYQLKDIPAIKRTKILDA